MNDLPKFHRRTLLKGLGAGVALPWLESLTPAVRAATALAEPPTRLAFVFLPNGVHAPDWLPDPAAGPHALSPLLEPLTPFRRDITVISGLAHHNARALGDGPGDHARSGACFLTGVHPTKTSGADFRAGVSVDQVAAGTIGSRTMLPSLELGMEGGGRSGNCDSGYACAYSGNISWRAPDKPTSKETRPRAVFERLFGDQRDPKAAAQRRATRRSVLDLCMDEARAIHGSLARADAERLQDYLQGVRDLEHRLERYERIDAAAREPVPEPPESPATYHEHFDLMADLMVAAFRTDRTRIVTFMMGNEGSNRAYREIGIRDGHHHLTHHGDNPEMIEQVRQINLYHARLFAGFLERLSAAREGDGSLLDRSMIVLGGGISDGNRHNHEQLPVVLAGRGGGLSPGGNLVLPAETPMCNLHLDLLARIGVQADRFGDSTGRIGGV